MTPEEEAKALEERALRNARAITGSTFGYTELETRLASALLAMRDQRDEALTRIYTATKRLRARRGQYTMPPEATLESEVTAAIEDYDRDDEP